MHLHSDPCVKMLQIHLQIKMQILWYVLINYVYPWHKVWSITLCKTQVQTEWLKRSEHQFSKFFPHILSILLISVLWQYCSNTLTWSKPFQSSSGYMITIIIFYRNWTSTLLKILSSRLLLHLTPAIFPSTLTGFPISTQERPPPTAWCWHHHILFILPLTAFFQQCLSASIILDYMKRYQIKGGWIHMQKGDTFTETSIHFGLHCFVLVLNIKAPVILNLNKICRAVRFYCTVDDLCIVWR